MFLPIQVEMLAGEWSLASCKSLGESCVED
jgi:hypothetical protein